MNRFSALVLCQTIVLPLLTHFCGGQSQMIGQSQTIVAMVGDDVILPCHLEPAVDAFSMTLEWARSDLNPRFVHLRREGVELLIDQNPSYIRRTSVSTNNLKCGDLSLKLSRVKLSDEGTYRCHIPKTGTQSVKLAVGLVSLPVIRLFKRTHGEISSVLLECESKGWYPKPEVSWLDGEGNLLSAGATETVRGPDGLYSVSSRVTVEKRHSNRFTCRVQQKNINQTREMQIQVPDDLYMAPSCSVGRMVIVSIVGLCTLTVVLGAFIMERKKKKSDSEQETKITSSNKKHQSLKQSAGESSQLLVKKEKTSHVDREKKKLDEELEKKEAQLEEVEKVFDALKNHKSDLKKQKEEVSSTLKEMIEKTIKNEDQKTKLRRRNEAREKILKSADKLIETTEDMIIKITEIRVRLEKDREQVNHQLKMK